MDLTISLEGQSAVPDATSLREWLHQARVREVRVLEQQRRPPGPGEQGPELLPLLTVVLAAPAVVELVRSIHEWIKASRPSVTITVENGGKTVTVDARNPSSVAELAAEAKRLAEG